MLSLEEAQLKLKDLRQAMAIEQERRYTDVQGRKKTFSRFVADTLAQLGTRALVRGGSNTRQAGANADDIPLEPLRKRFEQYAYMDLSGRMGALEALSDFIVLFGQQMAGPRTRITTVKPDASTDSAIKDAVAEQNYATLPETNSTAGLPASALPSNQKTAAEIAAWNQTPIHQREVQYLKGVGPRLAGLLKQVGVETVENLLYYFPRRYLDYHHRVKISDLKAGQDVTLIGTVEAVNAHNAKTRNLTILTVTIGDETGRVQASWFYGKSSRAALESYKGRYSKGMDVMLSGSVKWDGFKRMFAMDRPQIEILSYQDAGALQEADSLHAGRIVPVYALTDGLNLRFLRKAIHQALQDVLPSIADPLPENIRRRYAYLPLSDALRQIHFPDTLALGESARQRLVFDELFFLQLRLALTRQQYKRTVQGLSLKYQPDGLARQLRERLPFALTNAQERVMDEIATDMASPEPMYRMLQGDVGSGKTVVALLTLLAAVENGYQGALMAPTEILAEQHYRKCIEWLTPLGLKIGLFTGKSGTKERRILRQDLLNGQIHIAVGTHALIQDDVEFANLGVVVVDEQHRFGVRQRTLLKSKGNHPEMLTMTATPIPRSLAMTLHGDLDVSLLDERPPGRTPIKTVLLTHTQVERAYQLVKGEIMKGRQAYVVFPLIEESETLSARAATTEAERLQNEVFPERRVGLLHGKMRPEEKDTIMNSFAAGHLDILVSTTVVEVGVDVPNATVMVIENADRFGLSQLHQLRGRVGRGTHASYCVLVSDSRGESTLERLGIMTESEDGFYIAEKDLELRGPGEFLGTRQSGLPDFVLADLVQDRGILEQAKAAAAQLVDDPGALTDYPELLDLVYQKTEQSVSVLGAG